MNRRRKKLALDVAVVVGTYNIGLVVGHSRLVGIHHGHNPVVGIHLGHDRLVGIHRRSEQVVDYLLKQSTIDKDFLTYDLSLILTGWRRCRHRVLSCLSDWLFNDFREIERLDQVLLHPFEPTFHAIDFF